MGDENLRANEQSMATELESILSEAISAFPSKIDTSLVESNDGFRYLHVTTRVTPESLVDTIAKLESEFMVRSREDHVAGKVLLECSIPDGAWKQGELPEDYKRAFTIEVQSDSSIPRVDSANSTFPNNDVANGSSLLLSGGGFRATLFHLGVIRNLRKNQQLGNIKEVFSISGGSIAASHLAKRWDDYTGTEVQFKAAAKELVDFTKKGIREDIVRKYAIVWLIPLLLLTLTVSCSIYFSNYVSWPVVTALVGLAVASFWLLERNLRPVISLEKAYQKLLKTKKTSQISDKAPKFFFLATNLTTGNISCFGNKVFFPNVEESKSIEQQETVESDLIKLSQCVAASSAFPPLFSPYPLDLKQLIGDKKGTGIHYLTDGGVFDNLGLRACRLLSTQGGEVIVSDAERRFDWSTESKFRWLPSRAGRATDILMNRVNNLEHDLVENQNGLSLEAQIQNRAFKFARLQDDFESVPGDDTALSADLKRRIRRIRTDLDSFTPVEIQSLYTAGFLATEVAYGRPPSMGDGVTFGPSGLPAGTSGDRWLPITDLPSSQTMEQTKDQLDSAKTFQRRLLNWRSLWTYPLLISLIALLLVNPVSFWISKSFWSFPPRDFAAEVAYSISAETLPPRYASFVDKAVDETPLAPEGSKSDFLVLESLPIGRHTFLHFRPANFSVILDVPEGYTIFSQQAYLYFDESKSMRRLPPFKTEAGPFRADSPTEDGQLVFLAGVASEQSEITELTPADFKFMVVQETQ